MTPTYQTDRITLYLGDCLEVMPTLDENSIDSVVTDPPYGLEFMGKEWDKLGAHADARKKRAAEMNTPGVKNYVAFGVNSYGHDGRAMQDWHHQWAVAALRVAKPGAMLLAFGGTRTSHRLVCAIEDAGWQIRDMLCWLYGQGFPKSAALDKLIDKAAGAERETVAVVDRAGKEAGIYGRFEGPSPITAPATPAAQQWQGWGTALKPAHEPICLAMKPLDGTFAANAERWGVAGLNVDGARIGTEELPAQTAGQARLGTFERHNMRTPQRQGRFPANLLLTHHPECEDECHPDCPMGMLDRQSGPSSSSSWRPADKGGTGNCFMVPHKEGMHRGHNDTGGASRFFYTAKASRTERGDRKYAALPLFGVEESEDRNTHPTVKPLALMEYLCTLTATPTGGVVLDPFMGSGTTGVACINTGRPFIGIEKDQESFDTAVRRIEEAIAALAAVA